MTGAGFSPHPRPPQALPAVCAGGTLHARAHEGRTKRRPRMERRETGAPVTLEDLGWSTARAQSMPDDPTLRPARVASVYAARVDVWTPSGPRLASLRSRALRDAPIEGGIAVGDWALVAQAA